MLTFIIPFLVGTIAGFLIRGKPSDTFAMTTGRRVAWAIGFGFGGLLIGMPIGLAISPTTGPQIAGLIATGLWLGVFNILSIENATYNKWSERKVFAWVCGGVVALSLIAGYLPNEVRGVFPQYGSSEENSPRVPSASPADLPVQVSEQNVVGSIAETTTRAEQGYAEAQFQLGLSYETGGGVPQSDAEAVRWFLAASKQGSADAQYALGRNYIEGGDGVTKSRDEAVRWWRKAAEQGNASAQYDLAHLFLFDEIDGNPFPQDDQEGLSWLQKAANQGHRSARVNLGYLYLHGKVVKQSDAEAFRWLRLAADQGDDLAQLLTGLMYADGDGVSKNLIEAYFWLNLSSAKANKDAMRAREALRKQMSSEEVTVAQRRSVAWKPKK